jgi:hypothetical protein
MLEAKSIGFLSAVVFAVSNVRIVKAIWLILLVYARIAAVQLMTASPNFFLA